MQSTDSLRELNSKLLAEIAKLSKKNAKISELKKENAKFKDNKNVEFRDKISKVEQRKMLNDISNNSSFNFNSVACQISKTNSHCKKPLMNKKMDTLLPKELISKVIAKQSVSALNISVIDQHDQTSLEDKETDAFLDKVHKKKISDEIR
ncbi:hypothetical protein C1646_760351 [Rhizophagus diaphanus]|nr:hypothetical protein C1646_760351 [Rhizophagus diaphanus] [Rhizophagus sp. MUCL 43196]